LGISEEFGKLVHIDLFSKMPPYYLLPVPPER
jgi:hypothetical protein